MSGHTASCGGYFLPFEKTFERIKRFVFTSYERNVWNEYQIQRTGLFRSIIVAKMILKSLGGVGQSKEAWGGR